MEIKDLNVGEKLYNLVYWSSPSRRGSNREVRSVTITKVNKKSISLKNKYWKLNEKEINEEWFLTRSQCYERSLRLHQLELIKFTDKKDIKIFEKEIKYLKKKLKEAKG